MFQYMKQKRMASLQRTAAHRITHDPHNARSVTEMLFTAFSITAGTTIAALYLIPYDSLQCERDLFDASSFARLAMLLMFCGHTPLPNLCWIRRLEQPNARTFLYDFTVAIALSGLLIAFISIAIMVLNTTWRAPGRYAEKFK